MRARRPRARGEIGARNAWLHSYSPSFHLPVSSSEVSKDALFQSRDEADCRYSSLAARMHRQAARPPSTGSREHSPQLGLATNKARISPPSALLRASAELHSLALTEYAPLPGADAGDTRVQAKDVLGVRMSYVHEVLCGDETGQQDRKHVCTNQPRPDDRPVPISARNGNTNRQAPRSQQAPQPREALPSDLLRLARRAALPCSSARKDLRVVLAQMMP